MTKTGGSLVHSFTCSQFYLLTVFPREGLQRHPFFGNQLVLKWGFCFRGLVFTKLKDY